MLPNLFIALLAITTFRYYKIMDQNILRYIIILLTFLYGLVIGGDIGRKQGFNYCKDKVIEILKERKESERISDSTSYIMKI